MFVQLIPILFLGSIKQRTASSDEGFLSELAGLNQTENKGTTRLLQVIHYVMNCIKVHAVGYRNCG